MNSFNCVGRLTADPELKATQSGISVCSFSLAVNRPKVKDTTDFLNFVAWRQSAEYLCKYARKGNRIAVSGCLTSRKYDDKDGKHRVAFEIVCDTLSVLENANSNADTQTNVQAQNVGFAPSQSVTGGFEQLGNDDDLPF